MQFLRLFAFKLIDEKSNDQRVLVAGASRRRAWIRPDTIRRQTGVENLFIWLPRCSMMCRIRSGQRASILQCSSRSKNRFQKLLLGNMAPGLSNWGSNFKIEFSVRLERRLHNGFQTLEQEPWLNLIHAAELEASKIFCFAREWQTNLQHKIMSRAEPENLHKIKMFWRRFDTPGNPTEKGSAAPKMFYSWKRKSVVERLFPINFHRAFHSKQPRRLRKETCESGSWEPTVLIQLKCECAYIN